MAEWSPDKEDEENPVKAIRDMTEAFAQIEREKAERQAEMYGPPTKTHRGYPVYCWAYDYAWRETIRHHVRDISHATACSVFGQLDRLVAIEIHRIALLAAENFVPPELEEHDASLDLARKEETEQ